MGFRRFQHLLSIIFIALSMICCNTLAWGQQTLLDFKNEDFSISLESVEQDKKIVYSLRVSSKPASSTSVFSVEDPYRLVIDLVGLSSGRNYRFDLPVNELVTSIRLGAHSEKLRLVLDVRSDSPPHYSFKEDAGSFLLQLSASPLFSLDENESVETPTPIATSSEVLPDSPQVVAVLIRTPRPSSTPTATPSFTPTATQTPGATESETPTPTASSTVTPTATHTDEPTATATPSPSPTTPRATPTATPTATKAPTKTPARTATPARAVLPTGKQQLSAISFEMLTKQQIPAVLLTLQAQPRFNLVRENERTYLLTLQRGTVAGEHLTLPFFPPHDFFGITYVQAKHAGDDLSIRFGVERGVRISAIAKGNRILVRPLNR